MAEILGKGETHRIPTLVWTSLIFHILLGTVGGLILAAITPFLAERILNIPSVLIGEARTTFFILAASIPMVVTKAAVRGVLEAGQRFDIVNAVKMPSSSLDFLLRAIAVPLGLHLPGIAVLLLLSQLGTALAYLMFCFRAFPTLRHAFSVDTKVMRPLLAFGGWVTVSSVVSPVLVYLDRFLIGSLLNMDAVAYYTAPYVVTHLLVLPASLVMTLFPVFSSLGETREEDLGRLCARSMKYLLLVMGPVVLVVIFFARDILKLWLGSEYAQESTLAFQILAIGVLINSLARVPSSLLQGIGRPDITAKFHLLELLVFVGLLRFLISKLGIAGAAIGWTLRVGLDALLLFGASWRILPSTLPALAHNGVIRAVAAFSGLAIAAFLAVTVAGGTALVQTTVIAGLVAVFLLIACRYVLDATDRSLFISVVRQVVGAVKWSK